MNVPSPAAPPPLPHRLLASRARVAGIRDRARRDFEAGASGSQVARFLAGEIDRLIFDFVAAELADVPPRDRGLLERHAAVVAVGGTGRGEMAPHSDIDLLFLHRGPARGCFPQFVARLVPAFWDAGLKLGHSVQTVAEAVALSREEPEAATAFVDARLLWGGESFFLRFRRRWIRRVIRRRLRAFVEDCVSARGGEQLQHGLTTQQLQPDLKRSLGGLRDVHLLRWVAWALYGTADLEALRQREILAPDDARALAEAHEFLTRLRMDLHFAAGRPQDVLSRDEQLRIARARGFEDGAGQRAVERFMQGYFRHSTAIADVTRRFIVRHQPGTLGERVARVFTTHRINDVFTVANGTLDVVAKHRPRLFNRLEEILALCHTAVLSDADVASGAVEALKAAVPALPRELSPESAQRFLDLLGGTGRLGSVLRMMHETGLLELLLPDMAHARCLLQFNQYHSYTVDEHTLRAVEAAVEFARAPGPVGDACRAIHRRGILHLALLLHDLGKGFEEDHSEVGRRIAERMAERLGLESHERDLLVFLVHKHLRMSHLAFRRDISDPAVLVPFSREVGSPEALRMLYVLTAADLTAVGPGVWTSWKADVLGELFDRALLILGGEPPAFHQEARLRAVKDEVLALMGTVPSVAVGDGADSPTAVAPSTDAIPAPSTAGVRHRLDAFPPHYLGTTPAAQVADDLAMIDRLGPEGLAADGRYDPERGTVEYRLIARPDLADGCFHKVTGVLTAKRLEILSADISTSADGVVVDRFRVLDGDFAGEVPRERIDDVCRTIASVLAGGTPVRPLFQKHMRFGGQFDSEPVSDLPRRVAIDNDSSDHSTVIEVFAHDRPGLLYTVSRALYRMKLSVMLARIATHFDQVVDVFYVTNREGQKIEDAERLRTIQAELAATLEDFEHRGRLQFVP